MSPQLQGHGLLYATTSRECTPEPFNCNACARCNHPIDYVVVRDPRDPASAQRITGVTGASWAPDGNGVLALDRGRAVYVPLDAPEQRYPLAPATAIVVPARWPGR